MKEQLISFETAKLAKEKRFDIQCNHFYCETILHSFKARSEDINGSDNSSWAPTQSLLQKWLREIHNIIITVSYCKYAIESENGWRYTLENPIDSNCFWKGYSLSYETTLEIALKEALNLIK